MLWLSALFLSMASAAAGQSVTQILAADGQPGDQFGHAVALDGERVLVGAFRTDEVAFRSGAAYIFERQPGGSWIQIARLKAGDASESDEFGSQVSLSGGFALISAMGNDDAGSSSGSAYVFWKRPDGLWVQQTKLTASDAAAADFFGRSVSISGARALVSAFMDDDAAVNSGSAYLFERQGDGSWTETVKLRADGGAANDWFGTSVAVDGDRVVVGAEGVDDVGSSSGAAYVFERRPDGSWPMVAKLTAPDAQGTDFFGNAVSMSGDRILVGAYGHDLPASGCGAAYVFERQAGGAWVFSAKLTASDAAAGDQLGWAVALTGSRALVSANYDDDAGQNSGSAYVFRRQANGSWVQEMKLTAPSAAAVDFFGVSASALGERVVIGADGDDDRGDDAGTVYVIDLPSVLATTPVVELPIAVEIESAWPNPADRMVWIALDVRKPGPVAICLTDILGREVMRLDAGTLATGRHEIPIDATGRLPGTYFLRTESSNGTATRPVILLR